MHLGRMAWGVVAAAVGFATLGMTTMLAGGLPRPGRAAMLFLGVSGAVMLAVDRLGLMATPYADAPPPTLGLDPGVRGGRPASTPPDVG